MSFLKNANLAPSPQLPEGRLAFATTTSVLQASLIRPAQSTNSLPSGVVHTELKVYRARFCFGV